MSILVTGGAGFIGSHTCLSLLEKGYNIVVIDSFINSNKLSLERVKDLVSEKNSIQLNILKGDIRDQNLLNDIFLNYKSKKKPITSVIHFAGLKSVKESVINPIKYWDINVNGALTLFSKMKEYECHNIVFSSSATIYGKSNQIRISEKTQINPTNPYGQTKAAIEKILYDLFSSKKEPWKIANLRYFNPIGAHESGLIGESPLGIPNNIFPFLTKVAQGNLEKLNIFGNDWPTKDGTGVRDYIHVMDLAEGHIAALEFLLSNNKSQIINLNLGTGLGTSVLELVRTFEKVNNVNINYKFVPRREGDVANVVADNRLAKSILNWQPRRSLEEMCLDGWNWQCLNPKGYI